MSCFCQRLHRAHDGAIGAGSLISKASLYLPWIECAGRKHISLRPLCPHLVCTSKCCLLCSSVSPAAASKEHCQKHHRFLTLIAPPDATVERAMLHQGYNWALFALHMEVRGVTSSVLRHTFAQLVATTLHHTSVQETYQARLHPQHAPPLRPYKNHTQR